MSDYLDVKVWRIEAVGGADPDTEGTPFDVEVLVRSYKPEHGPPTNSQKEYAVESYVATLAAGGHVEDGETVIAECGDTRFKVTAERRFEASVTGCGWCGARKPLSGIVEHEEPCRAKNP